MTRLTLVAAFALVVACTSRKAELKKDLSDIFKKQEGTFAVALHDLKTGEEVLINERESFHAASTMKTPVLIEVFKQVDEGRFVYTDSIMIKTEFSSIVDGSPFNLDSTSDSEHGLYRRVGQRRPLSELVEMMITKSSNLATNLIIEKVDAKRVTATMRELGARDIAVLRGVEDSKAFAKGMNNSVTAFDLMLIYESIASGKAVNKESSDEMIRILLEQEFNSIIPAKLPADVKVAHKTGWITGVHHDSGIVFLPDGRSYVLVLLSKGIKDEKAGIEAMAAASEKIYRFVVDVK
jgi:beta-lactamase class A